MAKNVDKAGEQYWSTVWENSDLAPSINVHSKNINYFTFKKYHAYFEKYIDRSKSKNQTMLEIGCGNSAWLAYFAKEFDFQIYGLDYSQKGCDQAEQILKREGVEGKIILGDIFNPPKELVGKFDYICSFGVVEHFEDTVDLLKKFSVFLKPGGYMFTTIPNMNYTSGFLQKTADKAIYDVHVPLTKTELVDSIEKAGFEVLQDEHFPFIGFNATLPAKKDLSTKLKKYFILTLSRFSKIFWLLESITGANLKGSKYISPSIITIAKKKNNA